MIRRRRAALAAWVALALAASAGKVSAHEGGAARVTVTLSKDGRYRIDARLDPEHLPPSSPIASAAALRQAFVDALSVDFDGVGDTPRAALEGDVAPGRFLALRLEGRIPPGARTVRLRDDAPIGEILVEVRNEGIEQPERVWSRAGWEAGPFTIAEPPPVPSIPRTAATYLALGFRHIVPDGLDHILFVLGLFLASRTMRSLLAQVTAFTLAHSMTLGLAMLGVVTLPPSIVEPAIAISIVVVAVENVVAAEVGRGRVALVFAFGLLHGLGFAGALREIGLPRSRFAPALLSFNLGVEAGQLAVIAIASIALGFWAGRREGGRSRAAVPASVAIAAVGLYWTFERLF